MNRGADSFLRLGLLMLKEARQQLFADHGARQGIDQLIAELQALANNLAAPNPQYSQT